MSVQVVKRNGSRQNIDITKVASKIQFLITYIYPLEKVNLQLITDQVKLGLHDGISTREIDVFTARKCMELASTEPEYSVLASRILVNNHHKNTLTGFKDKMEKLFRRVDSSGASHPLLNRVFYKFICTNQRKLEAMIDYKRDYLLDPFGFLTLENQYCNQINGEPVERPQDLYMKEAITVGMNSDDFHDQKALEEIWLVYDLLSTHKFTFATPTLNNAGMKNQQMSSCFLLGTGDSLLSINKTLDDACKISKLGGGIGIHVSNLRSAGQLIRGTNGQSSGIRNFLRMYGTAADAYNQGGKRKGSFAIFLRDYHPDILEFIQLKNPVGDDTQRARSLFLCVALSDLFWKSVQEDKDWYLVDPEEHLGLDELYGEEFEAVISKLVEKKKYKKKLKARELLKEIMKQQFEAGVPYIINFDHINRKSNLQHYMPVKSSNLCVEITLPSNHLEYAVCNLASMILPSYVGLEPSHGNLDKLRIADYMKWVPLPPGAQFDFPGLLKVTQIVTRMMDRIIDRNHYPVKETMLSNILHRPIGIGACGFADICCMLRTPYDSAEGIQLTSFVYETIAYSAYSESSRLAKVIAKKQSDQIELSRQIFHVYDQHKKYILLKGKLEELGKMTNAMEEYAIVEKEMENYPSNPNTDIIPLAKQMGVYPSYHYGKGSPASHGILQCDMWNDEKREFS